MLRLTADERRRHAELETALHAVRVPIRYDSRFVCEYVFFERGSVETVVQRLCEAKYLHEYCDFPAGLCNAVARAPGRLPRPQWLAHVRRCVLQTVQRDSFPSVWPWLEDQRPQPGSTQTDTHIDLVAGASTTTTPVSSSTDPPVDEGGSGG